jgi:GDP-L-fucose synthase
MKPTSRIFVAGHNGLVGSAVLRHLDRSGYRSVLTATRSQLDLRDQAAVNYWFRANRPEYVFLVAGTVGGILANSTRPAEFIYDNMMIHATVVHAAHVFGVEKLLYLGSSCIYPREARQPMTEDQLLTGPLEPTNESYAIAKIAGIKLCQAYRRPSSASSTTRSSLGLTKWWSGAPAPRAASSCTSTIWPMPACSSCSTTTRKATST